MHRKRLDRFAKPRDLQCPIDRSRFRTDLHLLHLRLEAEHFYGDFPDTGSEIESVPTVFVGIGNHLRAALPGSYGGAGMN